MQIITHILGTVTAALCAVLLLRAYARSRARLLLWSGLCFAGLTAANAMLIVDLMIGPQYSLYTVRLVIPAVALLSLLYGLIFESD